MIPKPINRPFNSTLVQFVSFGQSVMCSYTVSSENESVQKGVYGYSISKGFNLLCQTKMEVS